MDEARVRSNGAPVTGEDLWYLEHIDHSDFECVDCQLPVIPCSYQKDLNLRHPYFRVHKGALHKEGCRYNEGNEKLRNLAKQQSIKGKDGFPLSYPSRFDPGLHVDAVINEESEHAGGRAKSRRPGQSKGEGGAKKPHHYTTLSFRAIVSHYLNFPHDRDVEFRAQGINGATYDECFQLLRQPRGKQTFFLQEPGKIYFSEASWKAPERMGTTVRIQFGRGLWSEKDGKPLLERPFYLDVDMSAWPELTRESFLHEFNKGRKDVLGEKNKELLVFFIGGQDREGDFYRFSVNDHRLIAVKVVDKG